MADQSQTIGLGGRVATSSVRALVGTGTGGIHSKVECLLIMRWIKGSIPHGGPFELFLIPVSALQLV